MYLSHKIGVKILQYFLCKQFKDTWQREAEGEGGLLRDLQIYFYYIIQWIINWLDLDYSQNLQESNCSLALEGSWRKSLGIGNINARIPLSGPPVVHFFFFFAGVGRGRGKGLQRLGAQGQGLGLCFFGRTVQVCGLDQPEIQGLEKA